MKRQPKRVPPEVAQAAAEFLAKGATMVPDPTSEDVAVIMAQLHLMGLIDDPEWEGISSSVKQYALAAAMAARDHMGSAFVTADKELLRRADDLERRFTVRPMSVQSVIDIAVGKS